MKFGFPILTTLGLMKSSRARFVLLASDLRLGRRASVLNRWDVVHLSHVTKRRRALFENLRDLRIAPENVWAGEREDVLLASRLLLNTHQDEFPIMAPLRIAIAAAYRLPVISEAVIEQPSAYDAMDFAELKNCLQEFAHVSPTNSGCAMRAKHCILRSASRPTSGQKFCGRLADRKTTIPFASKCASNV